MLTSQECINGTAECFEKCSQNGGRVGYLTLELIKYSLLENESRHVILNNQALPKFYTHEKSWHRGHGGKMYGVFFLLLFFLFFFIPNFFLLSLFFPTFSFAFYCAFRMLGHFSRAGLVLTGLHYKGTMVNQTFLVQKFDHFFLLWTLYRPSFAC